MVEYIPPPDPRPLLAPLLACLPAAFASPKPPPALPPLLSPILRQRVQLLGSSSASSPGSWLTLLCWDPANAEKVEKIVGEGIFEPHPVSGEIEIEDITIRYKRLDEETLRARLPLDEFDLTILYVWCPADPDGGGPGWRVAEVLPLDATKAEDNTWAGSIGEANELRGDTILQEAIDEAEKHDKVAAGGPRNDGKDENGNADDDDDDDDDDYWAQYDGTPSGTPGPNEAPPLQSNNQENTSGQAHDGTYFGRYADVQPALDGDDPTVDRQEMGDTSLNGNALNGIFQKQMEKVLQQRSTQSHNDQARPPPQGLDSHPTDPSIPLSHPRPSSASSTSSDAVFKLEQSAQNQSASEIGVKQHISTNIKSLFRLAKSSGMSRQEFQGIITRELEVLELVEADEY